MSRDEALIRGNEIDLSETSLNETGLNETGLNESNLNEADVSEAEWTEAGLNKQEIGAGLGEVAQQRVAIFASGSGSNYEAIMNYFAKHGWQKGRVALLVCDKPGAYVVERAQKWATPTLVVSPKDFSSKAAYETEVVAQLQEQQIDFIVLAGYMRLLGPNLLQPYMGKVINIHPSILPAFPGKDAIGQAIQYGVRLSGITIHYVDEGMDTGPIIAQQVVQVTSEDTRESLAAKIQEVEHQFYPEIIQACVEGKISLEGGKVIYGN